MNSSYFTRSKACRPSITSDIPSDVETDDVAPETAISGIVRLPVTVVEELRSMSLQLAVPRWRVRTVDPGQRALSWQGLP